MRVGYIWQGPRLNGKVETIHSRAILYKLVSRLCARKPRDMTALSRVSTDVCKYNNVPYQLFARYISQQEANH